MWNIKTLKQNNSGYSIAVKASVWLVGEDRHTGTVAPAGAALLHRAEDDRGGDQEGRGAGAGRAAATGVSNC